MNSEASDDDAKFTEYGLALHRAVVSAVRPWLRATVLSRHAVIDDDLEQVLDTVAISIDSSIAELVQADIDTPLSGPLERIRQCVEPVNQALAERGVDTPRRNTIDIEMRPADVYDLGPMTFRDLSDEVHDAGIAWGAAKAHLHLKRRG